MRSSIVMEFADGWHIKRRESWGVAKSYLVKDEIETLLSPEEERHICMTRPRRGTETIVAAAIRVPVSEHLKNETWNGEPVYPEYLIISAAPPARHHSLLRPWIQHSDKTVPPIDQGFITSTGRFVGRKEAMQIAKDSWQEFITPPYNSQLFSENLW